MDAEPAPKAKQASNKAMSKQSATVPLKKPATKKAAVSKKKSHDEVSVVVVYIASDSGSPSLPRVCSA